MKTSKFSKFVAHATNNNEKVKGGTIPDLSGLSDAVNLTSGGGYFWGYNYSTSDYSGSDDKCYYHFADGRTLKADCT